MTRQFLDDPDTYTLFRQGCDKSPAATVATGMCYASSFIEGAE